MAVDTRAREFNRSRADVEAERDAQVPLRKKMGTAWDVANAALFLASDEANFITRVALPVHGGAACGGLTSTVCRCPSTAGPAYGTAECAFFQPLSTGQQRIRWRSLARSSVRR